MQQMCPKIIIRINIINFLIYTIFFVILHPLP
jgi:hypothetical protein